MAGSVFKTRNEHEFQIFSSVEATINKQWRESLTVNFDDALGIVDELGLKIQYEKSRYVLKGSFEQIEAANQRLAELPTKREHDDAIGFFSSASYDFDDETDDVTASHPDLLSPSPLRNEKLYISSTKPGDVGLGNPTQIDDWGWTQSVEDDVASARDNGDQILRPTVFEESSMEVLTSSRRDAPFFADVDESRRSTNEVPIAQWNADLIAEVNRHQTLASRELEVDCSIWEYLEDKQEHLISAVKLLRVSLQKQQTREGESLKICIVPADLDDASFDRQMLDAAYDHLASSLNDVQMNCVMERCDAQVRDERSHLLVNELRERYQNVFVKQCSTTNSFIFIGPKRDVRNARKFCQERLGNLVRGVGSFIRGNVVQRFELADYDEPSKSRDKPVFNVEKTAGSGLVGWSSEVQSERIVTTSDVRNRDEYGPTVTSQKCMSDDFHVLERKLTFEKSDRFVTVDEEKPSSNADEFSHPRTDRGFTATCDDVTSAKTQLKSRLLENDACHRPSDVKAPLANSDVNSSTEHREIIESEDRDVFSEPPQAEAELENSNAHQGDFERREQSKPKVIVTRRKLRRAEPSDVVSDVKVAADVCEVELGHRDSPVVLNSSLVRCVDHTEHGGNTPHKPAVVRKVNKWKPRQKQRYDSSTDDEPEVEKQPSSSSPPAAFTLEKPRKFKTMPPKPFFHTFFGQAVAFGKPTKVPNQISKFDDEDELNQRVEYLLRRGDEAAVAELLQTVTDKNSGDAAVNKAADSAEESVDDERTGGPLSDVLVHTTNISSPGRSSPEILHNAMTSHSHHQPQPENGVFEPITDRKVHLPGYPGDGTIDIVVKFDAGVEEEYPEKSYTALQTDIFLPDNAAGRNVLRLLQQAFKDRLLFRVEYEGAEIGTLVPNGVKLITDRENYPDPLYLDVIAHQLQNLLSHER